MNKSWISAARPRTLPASASPVIAASAYAFYTGAFRWVPALLCLLFALLAQIASNMANDYFDYVKGSDKADRVGPRRAVASGDITPRAMLIGTFVVLGLACAVGLGLVFFAGWELIPVGVVIALFALAYTAGPYPLAYHGLGDATVFLFFGLVAVYALGCLLIGLAEGLACSLFLVGKDFIGVLFKVSDRVLKVISLLIVEGDDIALGLYLERLLCGIESLIAVDL